MNKEEETIEKLLASHRQLVDDITNPIHKARSDNLKAVREHIHHYVLLALAILGFTIPVLANHSELVTHPYLLIGGMIALGACVIYGMGYLTHKLQKDNNELTMQAKKYNVLLVTRRAALDRLIREKTSETGAAFEKAGQDLLDEVGYPEFVQQQDKPGATTKKPSDYTLDILWWLFIIAIVLYVGSIIPLFPSASPLWTP